MGRAKIAVVNSGLSVANLVITNLLQFVYRTVLIHVLGVQYAGISGLCASVIQIFALSELGISWAVTYYLYKPLKEQNHRQVAEIIYFLRKLYRYVGLFILLGGLCVLPFLDTFIKGSEEISHLRIIFLLFLINTASSYLFFSYYQILASADRKNYIFFAPQTWGNIVLVCAQICVIYFLHSYVAAIALTTISTITVNYIIRRKVIRLYPALKEYPDAKLQKGLKKEIVRYIKATMLYKLSLTVMTSSTSIFISSFIGIVILGIYSNYMIVVDTIRSFILCLINPMTAVVGEITIGSSVAEKETVYKRLNFLMSWICFFCSISLYCLLTPFITLWLGSALTLPHSTVILICIYFYVEFIISFSTKFRDACGLNAIGKFRPLITAILNIIIALLLVHKYGINGIISALLISRLVTLTWFEPWIIHRYVLKKSVWRYYLSLIGNALFTCAIAIGMNMMINVLWKSDITSFVFATLICLIVPNVIFILFMWRTEEFKYYLDKVKSIF